MFYHSSLSLSFTEEVQKHLKISMFMVFGERLTWSVFSTKAETKRLSHSLISTNGEQQPINFVLNILVIYVGKRAPYLSPPFWFTEGGKKSFYWLHFTHGNLFMGDIFHTKSDSHQGFCSAKSGTHQNSFFDQCCFVIGALTTRRNIAES